MEPATILGGAGACTLVAGSLQAVLLPRHGMLGASLRHRGVELLRRVEDLDGAAAKGTTAGIPLLHPWANCLAGPTYRAAGRSVTPELAVTLRPDGLILETTLEAGLEGPVPVSFGFHPYLGLPDLSRARGRLARPAMRRLTLDERGIPTGAQSSFAGFHTELGEASFDNGFALVDERSIFALSGAGRRLSVEALDGYTHAQIFAPAGKDYVALEPMTAPADALVSGRGLRMVEAGGKFRATFMIGVVEI